MSRLVMKRVDVTFASGVGALRGVFLQCGCRHRSKSRRCVP